MNNFLHKFFVQEDFCLFVEEKYKHLFQQQADLDSEPWLSWQLELTDMVKKLKDTIFSD